MSRDFGERAPAKSAGDARADHDDFRTMHLFTGGLVAESRTHRADCPACEIARLRAEVEQAEDWVAKLAIALQAVPSPLGGVRAVASRYVKWWQTNRALLRTLGVPGAELPGQANEVSAPRSGANQKDVR